MRGTHPFGRLLVVLATCLALPTLGLAQITFNYNFNGPSGFPGSASNPGYYSADRQAAIQRAGAYIASQFDARGTVNINLGTQSNAQIGNSILAIGGTQYFLVNASATNGTSFAAATSNNALTSSHTAIDFNSDQSTWFTGAGTSVGSGAFDMQSIALHEITHSLGFSSLIQSSGSGLGGNSTWSLFDANLRVGSGVNAPSLLTGLQGSYAFNSSAVTTADLNGNNLYFHGEFAVAAFGGAVPLAGNGDRSHLGAAVTNGVMLPAIPVGTDHRAYTNAELGMMIDLGWNQFVWKNNTGNFADNVSNVSTNSRWQNLEGASIYSPVGTITTNMVLRFGGTGGYTATNNLSLATTTATGGDANRFLLTRMILNGTAGTSTIAAANGNVFRFDSTIGVVPQIRQDGVGAFNITHPLELTGRNLQLAGDGTGAVTLGGTIGEQSGQSGAITKIGNSTFTLSGNNTYSGGTTINGGTLLVMNTTGSGTGSGAVTVNSGGTLGGTGTISGAVTVNSGGILRGDSGTGTGKLTVGTTTLQSGGILVTNIAANGTASQLDLGANVLDFKSGSTLQVKGITGFSTTVTAAYTIALLANGSNLKVDGATVTDGAVLGTYVQGTGATGAVVIDTSNLGFSIGNGNSFILSRLGNNLVITFAPVPEPALVLTIGAAGLAGFGWLRRRKQNAAEPTTAT